MASRLSSFLAELKRRKVYHVAVVYVLVGLAVAQGADWAFDLIELPNMASQLVAILIVLGFPIALVLAWAYEVRPEEPRVAEEAPASVIASSESERKSIVVLPFDNMSPDPGDAYFADGLTEEIITNLSYLRSLRVISRSSAMALKGTHKDLRTIGRELEVQYVLEGSVRKAGDDLRITAQLIDASLDAHLWAERYDGVLDDVFAVQETVSRSIVNALHLELSPAEEQRVSSRPAADPRSYDTLVLARYEWRKFSKEGCERAIQLAHQVLSVEEDNAQAYGILGAVHYWAFQFGIDGYEESLQKAEEYAKKALELDPTSADALGALAAAKFKRGDFEGCLEIMRRVVEAAPDGFTASFLGILLAELDRVPEALSWANEAVAMDPLNFLPACFRSMVDIFDGRFEVALHDLREARARLAPGEAFAGWWLGQAAAYAGEEEEARAVFKEVAEKGTAFWSDMCALLLSALDGDRDGVGELLENTQLRELAERDEYFPIFLANALALVGETDEALDCIEQAMDWGFSNARFLSVHNPHLESLRNDPRFLALMDRAREQAAAIST